MQRVLFIFVLVCVGFPAFLIGQEASASEPVEKEQEPPIELDQTDDPVRDLQSNAVKLQKAEFGRWGHIPGRYSTWTNHSNRLIPVYTFGLTLDELREEGSAYADPQRLEKLYGYVPEGTLNPTATYFDQTDIYRMQMAAVDAGYRNIILMIFDGMDWQTTRAASLYKTGRVAYERGRGTGLSIQDYRGVETDFGFVCTSPYSSGAKFDTNAQRVTGGTSEPTGGYDFVRGGRVPWHEQSGRDYLIGLDREQPHSVTDSASSATSMSSGVKTYNGAIGLDHEGEQLTSIGHYLQKERGFEVGIVTNVAISHASVGAAYAHNVTRKDYQDIARDLVGLPSSSHRREPLPGVDVLMGGGWGEGKKSDKVQGDNFVAGNHYYHQEDMKRIDVDAGGRYVIGQRTAGESGRENVMRAAATAAAEGHRLVGFYGVDGGHLPFRTADGKYNPTYDVKGTERYSEEDLFENPTLADMTAAALLKLETAENGFWLMVEAGDVDWANHANNIDNSIGAAISGDRAFDVITDWVEENDAWGETALIVTADHGHFLVIEDPDVIADAGKRTKP